MYKVKIFCFLSLITLLGVSACGGNQEAIDASERIQRIEFITEARNDQALTWQQYVVNSDGSNQINLDRSLDLGTDDNTDDFLWEPNGEKVAFNRKVGERFRAYISNTDGSDFVELGATLNGSNMVAEWSPNGESIIIGNVPSNDLDSDIWDVYVVKISNSALTKIITNVDIWTKPTWSPDGKYIMVHGGLVNEETYTYEEQGMYIFNPDGTGGENLTSDWDYVNNPTWSPNSKFVTFETGDENSEYLYMADLEGSSPIELMSVDWNTFFSYEWSDDSQYIVITTTFDDFDNDIHYDELYLLDVESGESTLILTGSDTRISNMNWMDDNYVTFNAYINGNSDIYRVNAKTEELENLTQSLNDESGPIPSPDGKQIAYVTNVTGDWQIHILNVDDNSTFKLTSNSSGEERDYRWSSDSKHLAYSSDVNGIFQVFVVDIEDRDSSPLKLSNTEAPAYVQDWVP